MARRCSAQQLPGLGVEEGQRGGVDADADPAADDDDPQALGVYRSDDDGVNWRNISAGLTTRWPRSLTVQPAGIIHLSTTAYGGGSDGRERHWAGSPTR